MSAPAELVIEVTAEDIRLGEKHSACRCPIARAAARLMGAPLGDAPVAVGGPTMGTYWPDLTTADYELPASAVSFIEAFDTGDAVKPFTFTARLESAS